jgi:stage II sporulation protein D
MLRRDDHPRRTRTRHRLAICLVICAFAAGIVPSAAQSTLVPDPAQTVRVSVLSLFKPSELILRPVQGFRLTVEIGRETLPASTEVVGIRAADGQVQTHFALESRSVRGTVLRASGGDAASFWLEVPGKLRRSYKGTLEIHARAQRLEAIVTMPLEIAVASVVEAESPSGAGIEALKAQAVAARSFLVARQTAHSGFDFCDTTHCQFLRSPPAAGSPADRAARATAGLVLAWHDETTAQDQTLAAMYARSCGGRTRSLREIGATNKGYPYYSVRCVYCSHHPEIWKRQGEDSPNPAPRTERDRLDYNRIHGWGAIPSLAQGKATSGNSITGRGTGHGIGMCQVGAADMDRRGASFAQILAHYYPNTRLTPLPAP